MELFFLFLGLFYQFDMVSSLIPVEVKLKQVESKLSTLETDYKEQKLKTALLESSYQQQIYKLNALQQRSTKTSAFCKILPKEICGPCTCLDDYELQQKYYCDCQDLPPKRDCLEFYQSGMRVNGVYKVTMNNLKLMQVYCDQTTDGGGWTVFQRRADGTRNFYRNWQAYRNGFGKFQNEFWLGNEGIHILTVQSLYPKESSLRIDMADWAGKNIYAKYNDFQLDSERTKYTLHVSGYTGNAGDSLSGHNGHKFSTYDQDNDLSGSSSCASLYRGAWWYVGCHYSNVNGEYHIFDEKQRGYARGVIWQAYKGYGYSLKFVEMKARRNAG